MMPVGKLCRLVGQNASRNRRHFALSAFGVTIGIAAFVFFLALSMGVRRVVLDIFPLDRVEVVAPKTNLLGVQMSARLDDAVVERIRARSDVEFAVPRMTFAFPILGRARFEGDMRKFELIGDGIDPSYVADEKFAAEFRDWTAAENLGNQVACAPPPSFDCPSLHYCERRDMKCYRRVPLVVSRHLLEIYNTQFAKSRGWPVIGGMEEFIVQRGGLKEMRLFLDLGSSMMGENNIELRSAPRTVQGTLLGISDKAIPIGVTIPIEYVKRWNREYIGAEAAENYTSIVVKVRDKDKVGGFVAWLQNDLKLQITDNEGERFALILVIVTAFFILISLVIVLISAINIAHGFFVQVSERRREIGLLRAIGATRGDIQGMILGEAALIGLVSGTIGIGLALAGAAIVDWAAPRYLPDFPFKPESFFDFDWWIWGGGLVFAVLFCVLGGFLPASRAAGLPPAQALTQQ
jgi:putative ABC transport system permease protein